MITEKTVFELHKSITLFQQFSFLKTQTTYMYNDGVTCPVL